MEMDQNDTSDNLDKENETEEGNENNSELSTTDAPPSSIVHSSPDRRLIKIRNPFEAALADRLHLPLIASPSLFQRPATPPMSSTQFEWTIEEVSSLKPANVEPHETQFQDSPDPELEARAQQAINTYFKEQQIVPSPAECQLRNQRIALSEMNNLNTPISKPGRRIRDCCTQTELTLPTVLPEPLEEALRSYFQPHLAGPNAEVNFGRYHIHDTSLKRKLFDMHNIMLLENEENTEDAPRTPGRSVFKYLYSSPSNKLRRRVFVGKLSDSPDRSSPASLSPFSSLDEFSPKRGEGALKRDFRFIDFLNEIDEVLSPIQPPEKKKALNSAEISVAKEIENGKASANDSSTNIYPIQKKNCEVFLPENNSLCSTNNIAECSADSFNIKISNLNITNTTGTSVKQLQINKTHTSLLDTDDIEMEQVLCPTVKDVSKDFINTETPFEKRRLATRKNLSHSFNSPKCLAEGADILNNTLKTEEILTKDDCDEGPENQQQDAVTTNCISTPIPDDLHGAVENDLPRKNLTIYRTDSGFNDFSNNNTSCSNEATPSEVAEGVSNYLEVVCSSTPTKTMPSTTD